MEQLVLQDKENKGGPPKADKGKANVKPEWLAKSLFIRGQRLLPSGPTVSSLWLQNTSQLGSSFCPFITFTSIAFIHPLLYQSLWFQWITLLYPQTQWYFIRDLPSFSPDVFATASCLFVDGATSLLDTLYPFIHSRSISRSGLGAHMATPFG